METVANLESNKLLVPAAQYLRVSTEHQQYSLENQSAAIAAYAAKAGYVITRTYADEGKSGLVIKRREGLRKLLNDVINEDAEYKAIMVYDVSRWGRFQDGDEAAHYEYICRAAGIPVHYCAEQFVNDSSLPNSIMKAIKRLMAAEYSRELSVKVHEGLKRVSTNGFRTGGVAGFGLRRMLLSEDGKTKCVLASGERKSLQSDRVTLVPGPEHEVGWVRAIFKMFVDEGMWPGSIAAVLRRNNVAYPGVTRTRWYGQAVNRLLRNPKYCGCSVFGQSIRRLHTLNISNPRDTWTITKGAWEPIINDDTFERAQGRFESRPIRKSDNQLLGDLHQLLAEKGSLSEDLLNQSLYLPSCQPYVRRFGSLSEAFEKIGYVGLRLAATKTRRKTRTVRDQLISQIIATHPEVSVVQRDGHWRPLLMVSGSPVCIYVCRQAMSTDGNDHWWFISVVARERDCVSLIVRLALDNGSVQDTFLVPDLVGAVHSRFRDEDPWLRRGEKLDAISDFVSVVRHVGKRLECRP